jgi:hypothetical protein
LDVDGGAVYEQGQDGADALDHGILLGDSRHPLRFAFRHALLRDAARGELGTEDTARWHGLLAKVLEQ